MLLTLYPKVNSTAEIEKMVVQNRYKMTCLIRQGNWAIFISIAQDAGLVINEEVHCSLSTLLVQSTRTIFYWVLAPHAGQHILNQDQQNVLKDG